jgi:competence protein ComGC
MELMLAVMIVTIIVAMSTAGYTRYRDKAAMLVDETNLKVLLGAVKLFAYDTKFLPGSLDDLLPGGYLGDNPQKILTCPIDRSPEGVSYGITTGGADGAASKPLSWLLDPKNSGKIVIVESDVKDPSPDGGPFARRHKGDTTYVKISAAGIVSHDPP